MRIETKYNIGDSVYAAGITSGQRKTPCPDCLGKKTWTCKTPAGEEFEVPCGTCEHGYEGSLGYLTSYGTDPRVDPLTIGSIQTDTYRKEVRYMCRETGIGSGTLHSEENLFTTYDEAMAAAVVMAREREREITEQNADKSTRAKKKGARKPKGITP